MANLPAIIEVLELRTSVAKDFLRYSLANCRLFDRKHQDYGPNNIARFGSFGCLVRMSDKIERINNLTMNKRRRVVNESVEDNLRDIGNYAIISCLWNDGKWPK